MTIPKSYEALAADLASEKILSKTLQGQKEEYMILSDQRKVENVALREELETSRTAFKEEIEGVKYTRRKFRQERDALQQRLTVAEQRADELEGLLRETLESGEWFSSALEFQNRQGFELCAKIDAALKPAAEDDSDLQKIGFVRMNTKTDQPRISLADMQARYEDKP